MANQSNYPNEIKSLVNQRFNRISSFDLNLISNGQKTILFGTDVRDSIELWVYNSDGTFAAHKTISATDPALSLLTALDTTGAYEFLNANLQAIANDIGILPGRYGILMNFFRNEVGSENTYQLYLSDISDDRTEVKITSIVPTTEILKDIYEFVTPSVPRQDAFLLIEQTYGTATEFNESDSISFESFIALANSIVSGLIAELQYSNTDVALQTLYNEILIRTHKRILDNLTDDSKNVQVQETELVQYVIDALVFTINEMKEAGQIDKRFNLV